ENEMKVTLAMKLEEALKKLQSIPPSDAPAYLEWVDTYPSQLLTIASQIIWSQGIEKTLNESQPLTSSLQATENTLNVLADNIMSDLPPIRRKKYEHLITELVHQRDVTRKLIKNKVSSAKDFAWLYEMRFYWDETNPNVLKRLK